MELYKFKFACGYQKGLIAVYVFDDALLIRRRKGDKIPVAVANFIASKFAEESPQPTALSVEEDVNKVTVRGAEGFLTFYRKSNHKDSEGLVVLYLPKSVVFDYLKKLEPLTRDPGACIIWRAKNGYREDGTPKASEIF